MTSNAIISVYDKTGLVEFADTLRKQDVNLYSTGGTYQELKSKNIPVKKIEEYTGFPEMLSGRVKSLHPKIHAGILARRDQDSDTRSLRENGVIPFDLVCVNLYPFEDVIQSEEPGMFSDESFMKKAIEMIDIGGPTMIRAAAKNHEFVSVLTNPGQYEDFLREFKVTKGELSLSYRRRLAAETFHLTARYELAIDHFFFHALTLPNTHADDTSSHNARRLSLSLNKDIKLRYGENPHQQAGFYTASHSKSKSWEQLHGKELSYNNLLDLDSALSVASDFEEPVCFIFKHTNPCGAASDEDQLLCLEKAVASDPVSCFGGIVLLNRKLEPKTASKLSEIFFEIIIAPDFEESALKALTQKKNLRLLRYFPGQLKESFEIKSASGGFLIQDKNDEIWSKEGGGVTCVSKNQASDEDKRELDFAWRLVKHVKSNAIVFSKNRQALGIGAGQMSRVDAARFALEKAKGLGHSLKGSYLASDAFFPFRDVVDMAARAGVRAVIQPGGSIRDEESIQAADEAGIVMMFTGMRHFRH